MQPIKPSAANRGGLELSLALIEILPKAPARVLLIGQHLDSLVDALETKSYQIVQTSYSISHEFAQFPSETRQGIYQLDIDFSIRESSDFDAVWVQGVSSQMHPLDLFEKLSHMLNAEGLVVLMGQHHQGTPPRVSRWLEYLVAIGARCGFTALELESDVASAGHGTFVKVFRKTAVPRWQLRHLRSGDYAEIAVLFQEVFGHAISPALWAWKYANGHGNAVLASRDGVLVAHYGGMYREILLCGKPDWAYGGSDVMVHPKERGVMTRQGPFLLTAATTAEIYGPVAFGFPTERAMLVAERMGLYTKAGQMAEIRWEPAAPRLRLHTRVRSLTQGNTADHELVDGLWMDMAKDLQDSVVGVRDWKFLEYRYFGHPHNQYEVMVVTSRWTGNALGVMVLRRLEGSCELLDVVAPLGNLRLVLDQARRLTARWSLPYLYCWITANQAQHFVACGGKKELLNVYIPTSCWTDDPRVDMLIDKWWLMSGDTDFR